MSTIKLHWQTLFEPKILRDKQEERTGLMGHLGGVGVGGGCASSHIKCEKLKYTTAD